MKVLRYEVKEMTTRPRSNSYVLQAVVSSGWHIIAEYINRTPSREDIDFAIQCWKRGFTAACNTIGSVQLNASVTAPTEVDGLSFRKPVQHTQTKTVSRGPVSNGPKVKIVRAEEPDTGIRFRKSKF